MQSQIIFGIMIKVIEGTYMKKILTFILLILPLFFVACKDKDTYVVKTMYLDSAFSIVPIVRVVDTKAKLEKLTSLRDELSLLTNELDDVFNPNKETSVVSLINKNAGISPVEVSDEVILVIKKALEVAQETIVEGVALYDITILPVWEKWLFPLRYYDQAADNRDTIPQEATINEVLPLVDYTKVVIDDIAKTVYLSTAGMKIDLGSIVKGYSCDKIKAYLLSIGLTRAVIDVGGNIMTMGYNHYENRDHEWPIKIQTPYINIYSPNYAEVKHIGLFYDSSVTVVSSGVYERYIKTIDGTEYHHILDPRSGYSLNAGLLSVTIIMDISMNADAYSTAAFSLGLNKGMELVNNHPEIEAVFITVDKEIYISRGMEDRFEFNEAITPLGYTYKGVYNETSN